MYGEKVAAGNVQSSAEAAGVGGTPLQLGVSVELVSVARSKKRPLFNEGEQKLRRGYDDQGVAGMSSHRNCSWYG